MGIIRLETLVHATPERCFDLSRSVDLHILSATHTGERAVAGVTCGLMKLGDIVTWEAKHFGIKQRLTVKITAYNRPHSFADSQVQGIFQSFDHVHSFERRGDQTAMHDRLAFRCPFGILGTLADPIVTMHIKSFLTIRNRTIKQIAEGEDWPLIDGQ